MYNYQQDAARKEAEREKAVYDKLLTKYEALNVAADEGVFQVTIQTDSGAITVPVSFTIGRGIAVDLMDVLSDWIIKIESNLNSSLEAIGDEIVYERKEKEARQEAQEKRVQDNKQMILAQQAAATAAPVQRQPGRPRKVATQELAIAASAVPMNGTSQQPGGGVANQPQG